MLAIAWAVRDGLPSPATAVTGAATADSQRAAVMMQLAYSLSQEVSSDSVLLVPFHATDAYSTATAAVGLAAQGVGIRIRVLAWGLPANEEAPAPHAEYTVEALLRDGTRRVVGTLNLSSQRRWVLDAVLPYRSADVERIVILRRGQPVMEANLATTERGLHP